MPVYIKRDVTNNMHNLCTAAIRKGNSNKFNTCLPIPNRRAILSEKTLVICQNCILTSAGHELTAVDLDFRRQSSVTALGPAVLSEQMVGLADVSGWFG